MKNKKLSFRRSFAIAAACTMALGCCPAAVYAAVEAEDVPILAAEDAQYVLMNIPYDSFYRAANTTDNTVKYDAITSATNKVGNYGKAGGAFHDGKTADVAADGTITAVGEANGAKNDGVIWPVRVANPLDLTSLQGKEVKDGDNVTVATLGRGSTSSTDLVGYETLMEAPVYSWYALDQEPDNYLEMTVDHGTPVFSAGKETPVKSGTIEPTVSTGTNWGDIQLGLGDAKDASDKLISGMVITAVDGSGAETKVGLVHLYNIWSSSDVAWKTDEVSGLDGKTITNIRYYCMIKDVKNDDGTDEDGVAPAYENYVYDYKTNLSTAVYDGPVTAAFNGAGYLNVTGLPADAKNVKAKVYQPGSGRGAEATYLTPLAVDPADDDIDPVAADVVDGRIEIAAGSVTNKAGTTKNYGETLKDTEYTIELSSDNWLFRKIYATWDGSEGTYMVSYSANGQSGVKNLPAAASGDKVKVDSTAPVSKDKFFAGWNTKANGKGESIAPGKSVTLTKDTTLYAQWESTYTASNKLKYKVTDYNQAACTGTSSKNAASVSVPKTVKYSGVTYKVTSVAAKAFANMKKLSKATVGNNVTSVGNKAFYKCANLKTISLGTNVATIGKQAFYGAKTGCVVTINSTKLEKVNSAINGGTSNMTVRVPKNKLKEYKTLLQKKAKNVTVKAK